MWGKLVRTSVQNFSDRFPEYLPKPLFSDRAHKLFSYRRTTLSTFVPSSWNACSNFVLSFAKLSWIVLNSENRPSFSSSICTKIVQNGSSTQKQSQSRFSNEKSRISKLFPVSAMYISPLGYPAHTRECFWLFHSWFKLRQVERYRFQIWIPKPNCL